MRKYLEFRNISTILTTIFLALFGALLGYLSSKGINLPVTAETLTTIAIGIIFAIFGYYNAKNHNNLFDEEKDTIYIPIDNLDDDQITAINNYINKAIEKNLKHEETDYSEDPAIAYEESDGEIDDTQ